MIYIFIKKIPAIFTSQNFFILRKFFRLTYSPLQYKPPPLGITHSKEPIIST